MLDSLTAPTIPIGAEHFGRARDIRRKVSAEDKQYDAAIAALIEPVRDRLRRYPRRSLRPEMLAKVIQGWRYLPHRDWRLSCDERLDKYRASLTEHRLVAGIMAPEDDPDWHGFEPGVAAIRVQLAFDKARATIESRCIATLSLHALARRLQRAQDGLTEALMHDIALVAQAASGELVPGAGYRVRTDEHGGGWKG